MFIKEQIAIIREDNELKSEYESASTIYEYENASTICMDDTYDSDYSSIGSSYSTESENEKTINQMKTFFKHDFKFDSQDLKNYPALENINKIIFPENKSDIINFNSDLFENEFKEVETLGSGKFVVKSYIYKNQKMAIKFTHIPHSRHTTNDDNMRKLIELVREIIKIQKLSRCPNIVICYGVCLYDGQALICMEQMDMSLRNVFEKVHQLGNRNMFHEEKLLAFVAVAIVDALVYCNEAKMIHRDVKPDNILLNKNGEIKLCDFGESRILQDSLSSTFAGSLCYWPPERFDIEKSKYDTCPDIWGLGITLVEIVSGSVPYKDKRGRMPQNIILLQNLILQLDTPKLVKETFQEDSFSNVTREFVQLCLNRVPDRPKYSKLQETAFYKQYGVIKNKDRNEKVAELLNSFELV
uniref:mitogen-activated protein kinase kinase n=1 Tax=Acrobeloides nanus TaxID=290746 RepID=A0A914ESH1_9BILA